MGTPHTRWREMHQSLRSVIMDTMRSLPQAGCQEMASQDFTAASLMASTEQNHCSVAR